MNINTYAIDDASTPKSPLLSGRKAVTHFVGIVTGADGTLEFHQVRGTTPAEAEAALKQTIGQQHAIRGVVDADTFQKTATAAKTVTATTDDSHYR